MSMYGVGDFAETIHNHKITLESPPARVIAAWGHGSGMGGPWDEAEGRLAYAPTDWNGGFLMELVNGRFAYVTGWNDYSGWGCQDGASVVYFDTEPDKATLPVSADPDDYYEGDRPVTDEWDVEPADLNRWIKAGMPDLYSAEFSERMRSA